MIHKYRSHIKPWWTPRVHQIKQPTLELSHMWRQTHSSALMWTKDNPFLWKARFVSQYNENLAIHKYGRLLPFHSRVPYKPQFSEDSGYMYVHVQMHPTWMHIVLKASFCVQRTQEKCHYVHVYMYTPQVEIWFMLACAVHGQVLHYVNDSKGKCKTPSLPCHFPCWLIK